MDELKELQSDMSAVKVDVAVIKTEVQDMKSSVTLAVEKLATSMATMATLTEKLHNNKDEHEIIHERIDTVKEQADAHALQLLEMRLTHEACISTRKQELETKKNSPWQKGKDKVVEWLFVIVVALVLYILFINFPHFLTFMNNNSNSNPVSIGK
jgi:chromosome segregation ATPase